MIRHFLRIGSMLLIIQEITKTQEPNQTHIETHFWTYEPNETKNNTNALIKSSRNTIRTKRTTTQGKLPNKNRNYTSSTD